MEIMSFFAQDAQGNIMPSAECYLYAPGTTNLVSGLVDINGMPISNPFQASSIGQVQFGAPNGVYDLRMKKGVRDTTIRIQCADLLQALNETASFLGARATAPTTRADGTPLQLADRYLNTTDQIEYIYKSSGWAANNLDGQILATRLGASTIGAIMQDGSTGTVQQAIDIGDKSLRQELASDDGGKMVFTLSPIAGAVKRSVEEIGLERVSILTFMGAYPDYAPGQAGKDSSAAFLAAAAYCSAKPGRLLDIGSGSFKITQTITGLPFLISGNPGSSISYVNMPGLYGFDFSPSTDVGRVMGSVGIWHRAEGANIAGALRGPKSSDQYFTYYLRYVIYNNFCSGTVRIPAKYAFGWDFGARRWFTIGDCVGAEFTHNNIQGVFDIITDPAGQLTDAGLFTDANGAVLSLRMYGNNIGPSYYALEVGDRTFMNVYSNDFIGNMDSIPFVGTVLFNEPKIWNNNMNCQRSGVDMDGPGSIMISGNTIRRHRSGWKGATHDWNGLKLANISDLKLKDNTIQPDIGGGAFAGTHRAYNLKSCNLSVYDGNQVGVGNDVGFLLDNCTGVTANNTTTAQNRSADVLFDLKNNTRATTIGQIAYVSSFSGTVLRKDATIVGAISMFNNLWDQQDTGNVVSEWTRASVSGYFKFRQTVSALSVARQFVDRTTGSAVNVEIITGDASGATTHDLRAQTLITSRHIPNTDGTRGLGAADARWSTVYAATGAINTSDARHKTDVRAMSTTEITVGKALLAEIGMYQFLDSVAENGADAARWHVGMTVQRAIEIFEAHGLDPFRNAFVCYDEWEDQYEDYAAEYEMQPGEFDHETGREISPAFEVMVKPAGRTLIRKAGNIYSFRNDQLALAMLAGVAATQSALEVRISALEKLNA